MIHHSTFVTLWIQTLILSEEDIKERAKTIKWCINVAQKCRELANFNSLMSILGALQSCPVDRLKKTWEEVGIKNRKKVEQLFNMMVRENYKEYRNLIKTCSGPCVPFPGMWLSDLQFIECGNVWNKKNMNEEQINLTKISMVSKIILEFQKFQKTQYGLQENKDLQNIIRKPITVDDEVAYNLSIGLEPILSSENEKKQFLSGSGSTLSNGKSSSTIDSSKKIQKFENQAIELKKNNLQEFIDLIDKWNKKILRNTNDHHHEILIKEIFCISDALEIFLIKFCNLTNDQDNNYQKEILQIRLNQFLSNCLVGDSNKHQQLIECLRKLQSFKLSSNFSSEIDHFSKKLIRCFKIPPNYRELSNQLSETQEEILHLREQIEVLEQQLFVADKDHKEHQVQRKRLENQLKIIKLQEKKSNLIKQKDEKKMKILSDFDQISSEIQEKLAGSNQSNQIEWTNELMNLSKDMKGNEKEYIDEKKQFLSQRNEIQQQKDKLEIEKKKLLELLQNVDKKLNRLSQKQSQLEEKWSDYQNEFSSSKKSLVEKTDDLMNLIDDVDQKNKTISYVNNCMNDFHCFFTSVLSVVVQQNSNSIVVDQQQITKQQEEQNNVTIRDTKRYLQSLLQYIKYFEHAAFTLNEEWNRNDNLISAIVKLQLNSEVLHREFPQYFDLLDKSKTIKKELARLKKEFSTVEKQQLWKDDLLTTSLDEATRCSNSLDVVNKSLLELDSKIATAQY